jgi:hypothetical protein
MRYTHIRFNGNERIRFFGSVSIITLLLGLLLITSDANCSTQNDLIKGMCIEQYKNFKSYTYLLTTGAVILIKKNTNMIEVYQRIGMRRKLVEISLPKDLVSSLNNKLQNGGFEYNWTSKKDKYSRIIISGDSVIRFYNVNKLAIKLFITPVYLKINSNNNGLLALDNKGGIVIMPPDNISLNSYNIMVNKNEWILNSKMNMSVLFFGVCPPREFDWHRSKWPIIHYSSYIQRYPSDDQIVEYSNFAKVLELHQWVWKNRYVNKMDCLNDPDHEYYNNCQGNNTPLWNDNSWFPLNNHYIPDDEKELQRVIKTAHSRDMLVAVYFNGQMNSNAIMSEARQLKVRYNLDGLYLDGLMEGSKNGPVDAYLTARNLRHLFGDDGWINLHNTNTGYFAPFIQAYMDFITTGEHNNFNKWQSTTYNISNAIGGHWPEIPYFFDDPRENIQDAIPFLKDLVDISLKYNNRILFLAGDQGQWRFWRLYYTQAEMEFLKQYYIKKLSENYYQPH